MFNIEMLAAEHGDCLLIEYGEGANPTRILIDTGPLPTFDLLHKRLQEIPEEQRKLELLVLTHIDADHIDCAVKLLNNAEGFFVREIWFNGWKQLAGTARDQLGPLQGEYIDSLIEKNRIPWNGAFASAAAAIPANGVLPTVELPGGMTMTILSPDQDGLKKLQQQWEKVVVAAGWRPGDRERALKDLGEQKRYQPADVLGDEGLDIEDLARKRFVGDQSVPNGSSVAFLAEYVDKKALFLGDAHAPVLVAALKRLLNQRRIAKLKVNAVKVPHHGSKNNICRELMELIDADFFLISTNGAQFRHPDREAVARIISYSTSEPTLCFNYLSPFNKIWTEEAKRSARFKVLFPGTDNKGLTVVL